MKINFRLFAVIMVVVVMLAACNEGHAHNLIYVDEQAPTCTDAGWSSYYYCTECSYTEKKEISPLGHDLHHVDGQSATCTNDGWTDGEECSRCDYSTVNVIPQTGHHVVDGVCTNSGCDYNEYNAVVDFIVNVPADRTVRVLHLTDPQVIDSAQRRQSNRLGDYHIKFWNTSNRQKICYDYIEEIVAAINPDLILLTGDLVYGEFDDNGTLLRNFIKFMDGFEIPWAPVFGNHENECTLGVDWQCKQLERSKYCLFKQRTLTGNGNYTVGIMQNNKLQRVFFMMDTNGCGGASAQSLANGHTKTSPGFGNDQVEWLETTAKSITAVSADTKLSVAYHIQQYAFADAFEKYGFKEGTPTNVFTAQNRIDGDFGYLGRGLKTPWDEDRSVYNKMKSLGIDSIFAGHEHCNVGSVTYDGIRFQYGQKVSEYDRYNMLDMSTGQIVGDYPSSNNLVPLMGAIWMTVGQDGALGDSRLYMCKNHGTDIDWSQWKTVDVNGLQKDKDFTLQSLAVAGAEIDGVAAYKVVAAAQGKMLIKTDLLKGKSTFTFSVYLPSETTARLVGMGEIAIRVKPNELTTPQETLNGGYINFSTTSTNQATKLVLDSWQTLTVDLSQFNDRCTEFAFVIPAGATIYIKDMTIV